jgi:hypothetical protein
MRSHRAENDHRRNCLARLVDQQGELFVMSALTPADIAQVDKVNFSDAGSVPLERSADRRIGQGE